MSDRLPFLPQQALVPETDYLGTEREIADAIRSGQVAAPSYQRWGASRALSPNVPNLPNSDEFIGVGPFPEPRALEVWTDWRVNGINGAAQLSCEAEIGIGEAVRTEQWDLHGQMPRVITCTMLRVRGVRVDNVLGGLVRQVNIWCVPCANPRPGLPSVLATETVTLGIGASSVALQLPPIGATHFFIYTNTVTEWNSGQEVYVSFDGMFAAAWGGSYRVQRGFQPIPGSATTINLVRSVTAAAVNYMVLWMR